MKSGPPAGNLVDLRLGTLLIVGSCCLIRALHFFSFNIRGFPDKCLITECYYPENIDNLVENVLNLDHNLDNQNYRLKVNK